MAYNRGGYGAPNPGSAYNSPAPIGGHQGGGGGYGGGHGRGGGGGSPFQPQNTYNGGGYGGGGYGGGGTTPNPGSAYNSPAPGGYGAYGSPAGGAYGGGRAGGGGQHHLAISHGPGSSANTGGGGGGGWQPNHFGGGRRSTTPNERSPARSTGAFGFGGGGGGGGMRSPMSPSSDTSFSGSPYGGGGGGANSSFIPIGGNEFENQTYASAGDTDAGSGSSSGNLRRASVTSPHQTSYRQQRSDRSDVNMSIRVSNDTENDNADIAMRCVTVYGFNHDSLGVVLQEFHKCGTIVRHMEQGNWMHLEYAKPEQARKALLKHHFKLFGKQMLAVEECDDISFKSGGDGKASGNGYGNGYGNSYSASPHVSRGNNASMMQVGPRPRPLVPINSPMHGGGTPRKTQGRVSTVMSYIFGV